MKLFIDTSGSELIFALISQDKKAVDFFRYDVYNNATAIAVDLLNKFLHKNNLDFRDIDAYYFTIGPGSFTGMRLAINLINSIKIVYKNLEFYYIDTFSLLKEKGKNLVYIPFGKGKYYLKKYSFKNILNFKRKFNVVKEISEEFKSNSTIGYESFDSNRLEYLIRSKKFKKIKSLDKVKLIYG